MPISMPYWQCEVVVGLVGLSIIDKETMRLLQEFAAEVHKLKSER